jgi:DNA (cytosine-5)-methyltransferase 1
VYRLVNPVPVNFRPQKAAGRQYDAPDCAGIERFVVNSATPFIVKCNHTSTKTNYDCFRGQSLDEPTQTITKKHGLRWPFRT